MPALNIYDLGDRADLGYSVTDASGIPANAVITATSVNPSGIASGLAASSVATGVAAAIIDFDVPGRWLVRWTATGTAHDTETVSLLVRPNAPVRADQAYATIDDVVRLAQGRTFDASSRPAIGDVVDWLNLTAAEIDGLLRRGGYGLPIPATATSALAVLADGNALGAACRIEAAAPIPNRSSMVCKLYAEFKQSILAGSLELDAGKDESNAGVRSNAANQATGMFIRAMYDSGRDW